MNADKSVHIKGDHGQCVEPGLEDRWKDDIEEDWELINRLRNSSETVEIKINIEEQQCSLLA